MDGQGYSQCAFKGPFARNEFWARTPFLPKLIQRTTWQPAVTGCHENLHCWREKRQHLNIDVKDKEQRSENIKIECVNLRKMMKSD